MTLLLGIDEGTSAVKAVVFDADLRPVVGGPTREGPPPPAPGLGGAGSRGGPRCGRRRRSRTRCAGADGEIAACGLDHQGESVLAWDAETGEPLTPIVTWQDKRSQEVLDRLEAEGARGAGDRAQRDAARPLLLGRASSRGCWRTTMRSPRPATRARFAWAPLTRSSATARRRLRDRSLDRIAHPARRPASGIPSCSTSSASRRTRCPRSPTRPATSARSRHPDWPVELPLRARCVDQQAALAGAGLRRRPASRRRPTEPACSCSPTPATSDPTPAGGLAADRGLARRRAGRVGDRRRRLHRRRAARVAEPRPRPRRRPGRARRGSPPRSRTRRRPGPAGARRSGRAVVATGRAGRDRRA